MESHNVDFISGSLRTPEGRWHINCYQTEYKNYSLKLTSGYHRSTMDSCVICDVSLGPILTKISVLQTLKFEPKFSGSPLTSIDFFLKVRNISIMSKLHKESIYNMRLLSDRNKN